MSGGSYDYAYSRIDQLADDIAGHSVNPLRRAFADHLRLVARAAHDIEWVDSGDYGPGDDQAAIRAVLSPGAEIDAARDSLVEAMEQAEKTLHALDRGKR